MKSQISFLFYSSTFFGNQIREKWEYIFLSLISLICSSSRNKEIENRMCFLMRLAYLLLWIYMHHFVLYLFVLTRFFTGWFQLDSIPSWGLLSVSSSLWRHSTSKAKLSKLRFEILLVKRGKLYIISYPMLFGIETLLVSSIWSCYHKLILCCLHCSCYMFAYVYNCFCVQYFLVDTCTKLYILGVHMCFCCKDFHFNEYANLNWILNQNVHQVEECRTHLWLIKNQW